MTVMTNALQQATLGRYTTSAKRFVFSFCLKVFRARLLSNRAENNWLHCMNLNVQLSNNVKSKFCTFVA